jgi:hypothetical protein
MGAVTALQRVADEKGAPIQNGQRLDVVIPASAGSEVNRVTVEPGRWLVEATLPSGEVISEEVAVAKGKDVPVTLYAAEHAPHEWLGWQHLVGNIEGAETLKHLRDGTPDIAKAFGRTARTNLATGEPDRDAAQRPITNQPPSVHLFTKQGNLPGIEAWTNIFDADPAGATPLRTTWGDRNEATWLYRLTKPAHPARRDFVHVAWLDERFTVSLPLPWKALGGQRQVPVQVMVRMHPLERNVQLGVIVEDPDFAPMAGLMTASTLPKATVAVRQAREMLFGKELHPLGAAAGGYVLLAAGDSKESNWHSWIDNLADLFPNIPDGMILKASLRLRFPKSRDSADEARAALLEAFGRGIPYYAAGISWLLDGLTVFSDDPSVEEKMRVVQRVALRLDLSQAFTVIKTSDKVKR